MKKTNLWASIVAPEKATEVREIAESYLRPCMDWAAAVRCRSLTLANRAGSMIVTMTERAAAWLWPVLKSGAIRAAHLIRIGAAKICTDTAAWSRAQAAKAAKRARQARVARAEKKIVTAARRAVRRQDAIDALAARLLASNLADLTSGKSSVEIEVSGTPVTCYTIAGRLLILAGKRAYKVSAAELLGAIAKAAQQTPRRSAAKAPNSRDKKMAAKSSTTKKKTGKEGLLEALTGPYKLADGRVVTYKQAGNGRRYQLDGVSIKKADLLLLL